MWGGDVRGGVLEYGGVWIVVFVWFGWLIRLFYVLWMVEEGG